MSIIENKRRRELLLMGGGSFLAATALATLRWVAENKSN